MDQSLHDHPHDKKIINLKVDTLPIALSITSIIFFSDSDIENIGYGDQTTTDIFYKVFLKTMPGSPTLFSLPRTIA